MATTEVQAEGLHPVVADGFVGHGEGLRKTYGSRWSAALLLANSGAKCTAVSRLYDGLKEYSEIGSPDTLKGLRAIAREAFDLVAGDNAYARGLLADEFENCISLMDKVRPNGYAKTLGFGAILRERITEAAMLIAQLIAMLQLGATVSPDTYGDACAVSVLGVFMHDSLGILRKGWIQGNKTLEYYSGVDSRAAALFSQVCANLIGDSTRDRLGGSAIDLVRAHLTSNMCESGYGIGEQVIKLIGEGYCTPGSSPEFSEDFSRLERALLEAVSMRGATPSPRVMKAIFHGPETCSTLLRLCTGSFKADGANFARYCLPSLYSSALLAGYPDTDLTAFMLCYVMCVLPTWVPEDRIFAVATVHRLMYGLEGVEPEGVTTDQDTFIPLSVAYENIDRLGPTNPGDMDLRELCRTEFTRCWEIRRHRDAAWRHTRSASSTKARASGLDDDSYFRARQYEGLWVISDCLSAAAQGVSTYTEASAASIRAGIHAFESLAARRRAKQDHGRLLDVDCPGADPAAEAALGLYAMPDHDYGIGVCESRSSQSTNISSVYSQLLLLPGDPLWQLFSNREGKQT